MRNVTRKMITIWLCLIMLFCVGCSSALTKAENIVQVYLTALTNFNLDAMKTSLTEGTNEEMGIDTSVYESNYVQTDTYKKAVDSMYKALGRTIEFTIKGSEKQEDGTVVVHTTLKCADVNETAVDEFMQIRMDEYVQKNPSYAEKTELDQNNIGITVMAEAYAEFVQLQPKTSDDVDIYVKKMDGQWRIINGDQNAELKDWISGVFGTF